MWQKIQAKFLENFSVANGEEKSESYSEIVGTIVLKVSYSCDLTVNRKELNINYIIHLL
mgnify:CR=1 FL=1